MVVDSTVSFPVVSLDHAYQPYRAWLRITRLCYRPGFLGARITGDLRKEGAQAYGLPIPGRRTEGSTAAKRRSRSAAPRRSDASRRRPTRELRGRPVVEELRFSYPLIRTVSYALPGSRSLEKLHKKGSLWQMGMLFDGPLAVAASSDIMTVAFDPKKDNPQTVIFFPPEVRSAFHKRGPIARQDAVWRNGVWTIPGRGAIEGDARQLNDLLNKRLGGMGCWSAGQWLLLLHDVLTSPSAPLGAAAVSESTLGRVQSACIDYPKQPVGIHVRADRVVITYHDPRVISILSTCSDPPTGPEWAARLAEGGHTPTSSPDESAAARDNSAPCSVGQTPRNAAGSVH